MIVKFLIIWISLYIGLQLLVKGTEKLYYYMVFRRIRNMSPKEKYEWQKQILQECRHKAYQKKDYQLVEKINNLLKEKYND